MKKVSLKKKVNCHLKNDIKDEMNAAHEDRELRKTVIGKKPKKEKKVKKVMDEWKKGDLHSGSKMGPVVTKHSQAIAIALSEADKKKKAKRKK